MHTHMRAYKIFDKKIRFLYKVSFYKEHQSIYIYMQTQTHVYVIYRII